MKTISDITTIGMKLNDLSSSNRRTLKDVICYSLDKKIAKLLNQQVSTIQVFSLFLTIKNGLSNHKAPSHCIKEKKFIIRVKNLRESIESSSGDNEHKHGSNERKGFAHASVRRTAFVIWI